MCLLGANELAVQKAKTEITRLIKEELIRLVSIFFQHLQIFQSQIWDSLSKTFHQHFSLKDVKTSVFITFSFVFQQNSYQPISKGRYKVL